MKLAATIARCLLGLAFTIFGLNGVFQFMKPDPKQLPTGLGNEFMHSVNASHYMAGVAAFMIIAGVLLLVGRFVPLALTILGPIFVNILLFHLCFQPATILFPLLFIALYLLVLIRNFSPFTALLKAKAE